MKRALGTMRVFVVLSCSILTGMAAELLTNDAVVAMVEASAKAESPMAQGAQPAGPAPDTGRREQEAIDLFRKGKGSEAAAADQAARYGTMAEAKLKAAPVK